MELKLITDNKKFRRTADRVCETLRRAILSKQLSPGEYLVESKIAQELNVSITPVRQAFQMLATQGLLSSLPYKQTCVTQITKEFVEDVQNFRILIEPAAARLAFENLTLKDSRRIAELCKLEDEASQSGKLYESIVFDTQIHELIFLKSENALMIETWDILKSRMEFIQVYTKFGTHPAGYYLSRHQAIIDAMNAHDLPALEEAIREHIRKANLESDITFVSQSDVKY